MPPFWTASLRKISVLRYAVIVVSNQQIPVALKIWSFDTFKFLYLRRAQDHAVNGKPDLARKNWGADKAGDDGKTTTDPSCSYPRQAWVIRYNLGTALKITSFRIIRTSWPVSYFVSLQ